MSLEEPVVRHRQHPDLAVARVEHHVLVLPERLPETPVPSGALLLQHLGRRGNLGPAHRLTDELHPVVAALALEVLVHPHEDLEVLADALGVETADLDEDVAAEDAEGSGDEHEGAEP